MNDLISRQEALNALSWDTEAYTVINMLPSAQPDIIRCNECVYADEYFHCDYMTTWNNGDCFCSHAERKKE